MAKVPTPYEKVGKTHSNAPSAPSAPSFQHNKKREKHVYCVLCRRTYLKHEEQEHMHSMLHHRELETVLGKNTLHSCQACKDSSMGLIEYAEHISTPQHKAKLMSLMAKNVKPPPLMKILSAETMSQILERNKQLKHQEKKAEKKKKKKLKQLAGQRRADTLQGSTSKKTVSSKVVRQVKSKQVNMRVMKQEAHQGGSNNAVAQNKENKASSLQRPPHQRESTLQNQSGKLASGQTWHHPHVRGQFTQSTHHLGYDDNFSINNQSIKVKTESFQPDRPVRRPHSTHGGATNPPEQTPWPDVSQHNHYNKQYDSGTDFTSDNLPENGAIIFDHGQNESTEQEGSTQPASANRSANEAPIRDVDVSAMLRQIRRALGVREPCRADREARRQNSEAAVRLAGAQKEQPAGGSVSSSASASSHPGDHAKPKQAVTVTQGTSSVVASDLNGPSNSRESEPQGSLESQYSGRLASSEPNPNITRKVRIAHRSGKVRGEKEAGLKPTSNKLLSLTGPKSKLSWREVNEQMRKKQQERLKGMPRFGIELANPLSDQETPTQTEDLPLSEGFHWESFPDTPSVAHWTRLPHPPPPHNTTDSPTETQSDSQTQPGAAQEDCSSRNIKAASVKVEPHFEDESGDLREHSSANKRKHKVTHDDISDQELQGKKKKTKSNKDQDQMDQLLAVSLREEELCHSLQDLDKSLIQARNTLQAAYTDVQRLLLLRQQCTAEVNSLRAKRIEILQGMQGGYLGASNAAEKATTFSAAAAVQPRLSPLPSSSAFPTSSSQQPPPTNPPSSISQPHPAPLAMSTVPVKKEICQPSAVSCNPDTRQVPVNQPVSLFPSDLLPSLLLTSPRLAALPQPTTVNSLQQLRTTENTNLSPARQQGQVTRNRLNTVRSVKEQPDSDSEEERGGNLRPAAEKQVPIFVTERNQNVSAAALDDNGGNESDNSVEMMEPSNLEVIDIDESDNEETVSNVPVHQEPPLKSVSVEFSSAGTQTRQQEEDDERKVQPPVPVKDSNVTPDSGGVVEDEEPYLGAFLDHAGPVHGLQIHEGLLYTCSGDNTARAYSLTSRECLAVFTGHTSKINCLLVSSLPNMPARLYTGSSDQTIRCYSIKSKKCLEQIFLPDRILCLHIGWNILFAGLANGSVASYDVKTLRQLDMFECHGPRGISCLGTAQEGARRVLLVGSYDSTISVRDAKSGLLLRSLDGHTKTVLCMKVVNDLVFSGSSDTSVHAYNIHTGELVRIYKGHSHAVTSIVILGKVMVTACLDKLVRVYELQSHDRLQVYGGHSDMVMCMAIHKSVIYTGCYDGSVQAVRLNLMKNYRCWWQNCSLIFGIAEHLVQHLLKDHTNPNMHTVTCRWRGCNTFFSTQQSVRQELPEHMKNHGENNSKVQL